MIIIKLLPQILSYCQRFIQTLKPPRPRTFSKKFDFALKALEILEFIFVFCKRVNFILKLKNKF